VGEAIAPGTQEAVRVAAQLRGALLRGDFAPGQRLVEADLCEQFNASRFVIRAALQELAGDDLVEIQRNKGARVRQITLEEAVEITEARMVLEGLCAAKAAQRRTPADARELRDIAAAMRKAVKGGDLLAYSDLNATLHRRIREMARHPTSAVLIDRLHAQVVRHQFKLAMQPGRPAVSLPQHERIIAAVVAQDAAGAEQATRDHLESVAEALRMLRADR